MMDGQFIKDALGTFCTPAPADDAMAVVTHCLYPSNGAVSVYVSGGPKGAVVSDGGGAIDVLLEHNRAVPNPDRFLYRFCKQSGLRAREGKIVSPPVTVDQLTAAVMFVANASAAAARWGMDHIRSRERRDLRKDLYELLLREFPKEKIEREGRLAGRSNRQYRFDNLIHLDHQILLIDAVLPDANSINAHVVAHMDIKQLDDPKIVQRVVYDKSEPWHSEDLNLLQMAATLVPISRVGTNLRQLDIRS